MELEKLKEIWTSFDNRMQQQEGLKTAIIKEMLLSKSDKALSRLINYSYFSTLSILITIPALIWAWTLAYSIYNVIFPIVFVFVLLGLTAGIIQLIMLHKIDFSKPVNDNIRVVQNLNILIKRYLVFSYIIAGVIIIVVLISVLIYIKNIALWRWFVIGAIISVSIIGAIWEYKRMYRRNFDSILNSLEELKELEES